MKRHKHSIYLGSLLPVLTVFAALSIALQPVFAQTDRECRNSPAPARPQQSAVLATPQGSAAADDQGYSIWKTAGSGYCDYNDHNLDINVDADPKDITDLTLIINAYDVDFTTPGCEGGPEVDKVYINDKEVGVLHGANDSWSTSTFSISSSLLQQGNNRVYIDTDATGTGCWCVGIGYAALRGKVGFQITEVTPQDNAEKVDWEQPNITATFSSAYDASTLNDQTFDLFYWGTSGKVMVSGTVEATSTTKATFKPSQPLKDGVYYVATVWSKPAAEGLGRSKWVKGPGGVDLQQGKTWAFWTMPDLTGNITVVPVQSVENVNLIVGKPSVIKVFIRWDKKSDVSPDWQAKAIDVDSLKVSYDGEGHSGYGIWADAPGVNIFTPAFGTKGAKRKREYQEITKPDESYSKFEKSRALDSVNYYGYKPAYAGSVSFSAEVELKSPDGKSRKFTSGTVSRTIIETKKFSYAFVPVQTGNWIATGVLDATGMFVNIQDMATRNHQIFRATYPLSPSNAVYTNPSLANLTLVPSQNSATYSDPGTDNNKIDLLGWLSRRAEANNLDACVGIVPDTWLKDLGLTYTETWFGIDYARHSALIAHNASRFILSHEFGHMLRDWDDYDNFLEADEGFYVEQREDKRNSVSKLPGAPISNGIYHFMVRDPVEGPELWIDEPQFSELYGNELAPTPSIQSGGFSVQAASQQLLLAAGVIDTATNAVTLDPWYVIEGTEWKQPTAGDYSLEFYNQLNTKLSGYSFQGSQAVNNKVSFLLKVPYPQDTKKVLIKKGTTTLKEATKSANAPQITITAPTQGTVLSGSQTITWTATDADGDSLYYSVSFSSDNGATWVPLVFDTTTTSFSWNTASTVKNGTGCMIRVTATDGLNTSTKTVGSLTIANQPCIVYSSPSSGQQNVPLEATITMEFSDEMDEESITSETVTLEDGTGTRIPGSVSYDSTLRQALLVPQQTLTAAATYTVKVSSTVQNKSEFPLSGTTSFSFTTKSDVGPPQVVMVSPGTGALNIPINARVAVMFDEGIDSSTLTQDTFYVTSAAGTRQSDTINYSASTKTAVITFASDLSANSIYTATVKAGIKDAAGNTTQGDYTWSFQTGTGTISQLGFSGVYADQALDDTGDGLYDRLVIDVGVEVFTSGYYNLNGRLVDSAGQEIDWGTTSDVSIDAGVQVLQLSFKSDTIRSHGVNGPYSLKDLQFYSTSDPNLFVWKANAYTTRAYDVTKFNANLTLTGLPDVYLLTSQTRDNAFNLNDYALHKTLPDSQLTYEIEVATDSRCGVSIDGDDNIDISPQAGWEGYSDVTVKVTAGSDAARDTFRITVSNAPETTTTTTAAVVTTTTTTAPAGSTTTTSGAGSTTTTVSSGDCPPEYPVDCREQGSFGCCPADLPYCGLTKCYKTPPLCPMVLLADGDEDLLDTLRQFRNRVLYKTPAGKEYAQLFYQHAVETISILRRNPAALQKSLEMLQVIVPEIRAALQGEKISLDQPILNALAQVLEEIGKNARPVLKKDIARVAGRLKSGKIGILK